MMFPLIRLAKGGQNDLGRGVPMNQRRKLTPGSWKKTVIRGVMVCAGSVAILLPAWLPNKPGAPMERGTVELLQAALLAACLASSSATGCTRAIVAAFVEY